MKRVISEQKKARKTEILCHCHAKKHTDKGVNPSPRLQEAAGNDNRYEFLFSAWLENNENDNNLSVAKSVTR